MIETTKITWLDTPRRRRSAALITWLAAWIVVGSANFVVAQTISREQMLFLTAEWKGERFPDGRPKVPDQILARMRKVSIEEAWGVLRSHGYQSQFEGDWKTIHNDVPVVGRALTAQYMPTRPELAGRMLDRGHKEGRVGAMNSWPIDALQPGDVYVADGFGKIHDGTLIGDNLGNSIFAKSGNGVIFDGSVRDLAGLSEIQGFNAFVRGWDPTAIRDMMLDGAQYAHPHRPRDRTARRCRPGQARRGDLHSRSVRRGGRRPVRADLAPRPVRPPAPPRGELHAGPDRYEVEQERLRRISPGGSSRTRTVWTCHAPRSTP